MPFKKTFFDDHFASPKRVRKFVSFAMQMIAAAILGVAIICLLLLFKLALKTVLFSIGAVVFCYGARSLVTYFLARRKRGAGEERTSSKTSQTPKGEFEHVWYA